MTTETYPHWPTVHGKYFNPDATDSAGYPYGPETPDWKRTEMHTNYGYSTRTRGGRSHGKTHFAIRGAGANRL